MIPVQDLHLTLFVLTLREQDGSLQVNSGTQVGVIEYLPTLLL